VASIKEIKYFAARLHKFSYDADVRLLTFQFFTLALCLFTLRRCLCALRLAWARPRRFGRDDG
jgi:hypothetical protein